MRAREDGDCIGSSQYFSCQMVKLGDFFNGVAKKLNPVGNFFTSRKDIYHVTPDSESSPMKIDVVSLVLQIGKMSDEFIFFALLSLFQLKSHLGIARYRTDTINTAH